MWFIYIFKEQAKKYITKNSVSSAICKIWYNTAVHAFESFQL